MAREHLPRRRQERSAPLDARPFGARHTSVNFRGFSGHDAS
jgi:hypothetical protein